MPAPPRPLPPLQSLVFFEAAARHLNFTQAAEELGATQPAVSHRVRTMEDQLGVPLFVRQHRGVRLTAEGEQLYAVVRDSLEALRQATAQVRLTAPSHRVLTLATDFGFAKLWLMPRMHALQQALPGLELRLLTSQAETDPHRGEVDFRIVFDNPSTGIGERLFPELVVPVCSPAFKAAHGPFGPAAQLAAWPLLHLQVESPQRWMNWSEWFALQGTAPAAPVGGLTFNDYSLVIQAAIAGHGIALGWAPLVDDLLDRGELVIAFDRPVQTPRGYFLDAPRGVPAGSWRARFRDWLAAQCHAEQGLDAVLAAVKSRQGEAAAHA